MNFEYLGDPKMGIIVYKNSIQSPEKIIDNLEKALSGSSDEIFSWKEALVGEGTKMPEYRDCVDFKVKKSTFDNVPEKFNLAKVAYDTVAKALLDNLKVYQQKYNIDMQYMEAINFVRYGEGQHFAIHADHGFSYICTVSSIVYLNDNYDGGELWFPNLDLKWKPTAGDMVFFPSTYIYSHASLPVTKGIKYAAVTMFDYNDDAHGYSGFSRDFNKNTNEISYSVVNQKAALIENVPPQEVVDIDSFKIDELRTIIREEIQAYAMESWKQWQENGGANQEYSQYVASGGR